MMNADVVKSIIAEYKKAFQHVDTEERYKWEAIKCFQDNWNPNAENFEDMLKAATAKAKNLLDSRSVFPRAMILEYARKFPEETRQWFIALFDETMPLLGRIPKFIETAQKLNYRFFGEQAEKKAHYQDLHAISVYLTFRYPEKYYFYKRRMFASVARELGFDNIPKEGKAENLPVYFEMANALRQIIRQDNELRMLNQSRLDNSCYNDESCTVLTQDLILFVQKRDSKQKETRGSEIAHDKELNGETREKVINTESIPYALNTIFYGPPGTGKTYTLLDIDNKNSIAKKYFYEKVGQLTEAERNAEIVANLGWWEVAALCLLDIGNSAKVPQIIAHPLMTAHLKNTSSQRPTNAVWGQLQIHTKDDCPYVNYSLERRSEPKVFFKSQDSEWSVDHNLLEEASPELLERLDRYHTGTRVSEIKRYQFITFHQSYSYENFVEGICAETGENGNIRYNVKPGIFREFCQTAINDPEHNYALFIDEINRGNVSGIFGELITLIEKDKREKLHVTLPYSKKDFFVPKNLYIFGSMNTADRSIDALDSALRRRFSFKEMVPQPELLQEPDSKLKYLSIDLCELLKAINRRVEFLLDRDHKIGHSYFMHIQGKSFDEELTKLQTAFKDQIIPLLEEYFYGNLEKVRMVLGDKFIVTEEALTSDCLMCDGDAVDFQDKISLKVADISKFKEEDFNSLIKIK